MMFKLNHTMIKCTSPECPQSNKFFKYKDFVVDHPSECLRKHADCPNGCGETIIKREENSHFGIEC